MPRSLSPRLVGGAVAAALGTLLAPDATAQIPPDFVVVCGFQTSNPGSPLGGIAVMHPSLATPIPITGLPPELEGTGTGNEGCASILVDPRTGNLIVGEHCLPGATSDVHVLTLSGFNVVADDVYQLGVSQNSGWADQMAWFGDDIVVGVRGGGSGMASGVMAGHLIGILRPYLGPPGTPGTITPVPLSFNPGGTINALAVDEARGYAYFAKFSQPAGSPPFSTIWRVPIPGNGTPVSAPLIATISDFTVLNMACSSGGSLLVSGFGNAGALHLVDPTVSPATVTPLPSSYADVNGVAIDNATGTLAVAESSTGQVFLEAPGAPPLALGTAVGVPSGVAFRQSMQTYGEPSPGANRYDWVMLPNAGGAPLLGNAAFDLTIASTPGTALGVGGLALGEQWPALPVLGVSLLLDPASLTLPAVLLPGSQATMALPLPNNPGLAGTVVFAQTFHLEGTTFAASRGLRITLL